MGQVIGIHQPNFMPWCGFFSKLIKSDVFVILDDVEYSKNSVMNRNRIKTSNGDCWLTLPVSYKGSSKALVKDMQVANPKIFKKLWSTVLMNYKKAPFFEQYQDSLHHIFMGNKWESLFAFNMAFISYIKETLDIKTKVVFSSDFTINETSTDRLVSLVKILNGTHY